MTKTVKIIDHYFKLTYEGKDVFKDTINQYLIDSDHIDYEITTHLENNLNDLSFDEIYARKGHDTFSGLIIKDNHYHIYINKSYFNDLNEAEYIYMGMIYLKIATNLKYFILHASSIIYKDIVIMFSAPSGTGKSTHSNLWLKYIDDTYKLNDDKTVISINHDDIKAHGIPFSGSMQENTNQSKKIKAIVFIKQDIENKVVQLNAQDAILNLSRNMYRPNESKHWHQSLDQMTYLVNQIPCYLLACNKNKEAVETIYNKIFNTTLEVEDEN